MKASLVLVCLATACGAESLFFPARQEGVIVGASVRGGPIVLLFPDPGVRGAAAAVEASVIWRAQAPFAVRAHLWPLAADTYLGSRLRGLLTTTLDAMFDGHLVAAGLGVGLGTRFWLDTTQIGPIAPPHPSFLLAPLVRVGAADGLFLSAQMRFVLGEVVGQAGVGLWFAGVEAMVQVPVGSTTQLRLRGGAPVVLGPQGIFGFAELGVRFAIAPNKPSSRVFLTPTIGVTVMRLVAPALGLGVDWRL